MKILTACINALLIYLFKWWTFKQDPLPCKYPGLAFATTRLTGVLFVVFTFAPPQIPLFQQSMITLRKNSLLAIQLNGAESQFSQRRLVFRLHPQLAFQCKT